MVVSAVDEEAVTAASGDQRVDELVVTLAVAKATAVAAGVDHGLVLGCDSMFEIGGKVQGKPADAVEATDRIRAMRGGQGTLWTGHHLIEVETGRQASAAASTLVRFGPMTDREVDAYVATGEPLGVAGSFTLDGRSAPFIDGIAGDHTNVVGLSLPVLRDLLGVLGYSVVDLWTPVA